MVVKESGILFLMANLCLLSDLFTQGKNDEFLCSLSVFDAYIVTRIHKSSKPFVFAIKSTDPITLFENKSDYLHVFSVPEDNGKAWVEAIWLARVSWILPLD